MRQFTLLALTVFLTIPSPMLAQTPTAVAGIVTNALSGDPVSGATVVVEAPTGNRQGVTGKDGSFSIGGVPAGRYHLVIRVDGYLPSRTDLTVGNAGPVTSNVALTPELHFSEVTSVSPEGRNQFESFQATDVLGGQDLAKELQSTLGATLENQPGVALRSFGPGPARPVIRGLDGDRVLVVEDGLRMGDLSSQSGDHGINVNPAAATSIEVVRGPATLLYGANAIGGLVNVVTRDIPNQPVTKATGAFTMDASSGAPGGGGAADVMVGNGRFALHASGSGRRSNDVESPGGAIPNSFARAAYADVGASVTGVNGFIGASYAYDRTRYGIPFVEDGQTTIDPRRQSVTVRGERRAMTGFFDGVRGSFGVRRYRHDEKNGDALDTSFANDTTELALLAHHRTLGRMKGSIGGAFLTRRFDAVGEEALSPAVSQKGASGYLYEEVAVTPHFQFQFGGRLEHAAFTPKVTEPARSFTNLSGSVGVLLLPTDSMTVAFSLARAARNPALEELYFHGPHTGNNAIENGDPELDSEHALGFDASLRWRGTRGSGEMTFFVNAIDGFIFREFTGEVDDEEGLPVTNFAQADGRLAGVESHVDLRVLPAVWVEGGLDYVRGDLSRLDTPMPRIPPLRGRIGLRVERNGFRGGAEGIFTARQDRVLTASTDGVTIGETPTDGYGLLKFYASYSFGSAAAFQTVTARLDNATDARYRNHLNYLKDLVPEMGRNFALVYTVRF